MQTTEDAPSLHQPDPKAVRRAITKQTFATLATTSAAGRAHVAGVLYELIDDTLWINTLRSSRKARNIAADKHVAICIPVRRIPVGPPSTVQFQTTAALVEPDASELTALLAQGKLKSLTRHGELELPDTCFVRVALPGRALTYGLGMSLFTLIRDPLSAGGVVAFGWAD